MPWLTPDEEGGSICRPLHIPMPFVPHVSGALLALCDEWNWEKFGDITVSDALLAMKGMVDEYYVGCQMIGACLPYATTLCPGNMLACDGATYNRVDYPALYAVLADTYKLDADTFITPDLSGKFILGADASEGDTGGEETHTLSIDEMPSHAHTYQPPEFNLDMEGPEIPDIGATILALPSLTGYEGGGQPHNNMPPYHAMAWGIICR
jgi:microcystin-dependent protein